MIPAVKEKYTVPDIHFSDNQSAPNLFTTLAAKTSQSVLGLARFIKKPKFLLAQRWNVLGSPQIAGAPVTLRLLAIGTDSRAVSPTEDLSPTELLSCAVEIALY